MDLLNTGGPQLVEDSSSVWKWSPVSIDHFQQKEGPEEKMYRVIFQKY